MKWKLQWKTGVFQPNKSRVGKGKIKGGKKSRLSDLVRWSLWLFLAIYSMNWPKHSLENNKTWMSCEAKYLVLQVKKFSRYPLHPEYRAEKFLPNKYRCWLLAARSMFRRPNIVSPVFFFVFFIPLSNNRLSAFLERMKKQFSITVVLLFRLLELKSGFAK